MKLRWVQLIPGAGESPSVRRAWIEMTSSATMVPASCGSPSVRRAWIEIAQPDIPLPSTDKSPSVRRAWIEIFFAFFSCSLVSHVALREEGVD